MEGTVAGVDRQIRQSTKAKSTDLDNRVKAFETAAAATASVVRKDVVKRRQFSQKELLQEGLETEVNESIHWHNQFIVLFMV